MSTESFDVKYRLVVFLPNTKKKTEIDIVPSKWIYSNKADKLQCKFMPPPYDNERQNVLIDMIKNCEEPERDWPSYPIEVRGKAKSYEEAEKLVAKLQYQPYVYSTDNEDSAIIKATLDEIFLKRQKVSKEVTNRMIEKAAVSLDDNIEENLGTTDRFCMTNSRELPLKPSEKSKQVFSKYPKNVGRKRQNASGSDNLSSDGSEIPRKRKPTIKKNLNKNYDTLIDGSSSSSDTSLEDPKDPPYIHDPSHVGTGIESIIGRSQSTNENSSATVNMKKAELIDMLKEILNPLFEKERNMTAQYNSLSKQMSEIKSSLIEIKRLIEVNNAEISPNIVVDSDEENDMKLPCQNITIFEEFDGKLSSDDNYNKKIARKLLQLINTKQTLVQNTSTMMRYCMARDVALQYNLVKANEKKTKIFNDTNFYKIIKAILVRKFSKSDDDPLSKSVVDKSVSSVLNYCGDWDGGRTIRKNKTPKKNTEQEADPKEH